MTIEKCVSHQFGLPNTLVMQFLTKDSLKSNAKAGVLENPDLGDASYDLPFFEKEPRTIGKILPNSQVLVRKSATETDVRGNRYSPHRKSQYFRSRQSAHFGPTAAWGYRQ